MTLFSLLYSKKQVDHFFPTNVEKKGNSHRVNGLSTGFVFRLIL